jgi:hypothetical protein
MAVPRAMGSSTEAAGFRNTDDGRVMEGMYVVILTIAEWKTP